MCLRLLICSVLPFSFIYIVPNLVCITMNNNNRGAGDNRTCTESNSRISYLDISISICNNKYVTEVYDKRENFNFKIVNYPYMCSNIPAKPTYGVYVSQLIRISRICDNYVSFVKRHRLLTERLIKQGFWYNKLSISFKKFSRRHSMLFNKYAVSVKRHIREGICIPLDVKPDLVRNITTRNHGCGQCA